MRSDRIRPIEPPDELSTDSILPIRKFRHRESALKEFRQHFRVPKTKTDVICVWQLSKLRGINGPEASNVRCRRFPFLKGELRLVQSLSRGGKLADPRHVSNNEKFQRNRKSLTNGVQVCCRYVLN